MTKVTLVVFALFVLAACNKAPNATGQKPANPNDPVEKKLLELAGGDAKSCGHLKAQVEAEMDTAGKCVMQSAQQKQPFYVAYDLPGMVVGIAGNSEGKLFSVQTQASATGGLAAVPCPSELRIAPSGRATCYAPGTFPMGGSMNSHSGIPPASGENPHKSAAPVPKQ